MASGYFVLLVVYFDSEENSLNKQRQLFLNVYIISITNNKETKMETIILSKLAESTISKALRILSGDVYAKAKRMRCKMISYHIDSKNRILVHGNTAYICNHKDYDKKIHTIL